MKKYLKYLGYGFLTLVLYCPIHIFMAITQAGIYDAYRDKIYGTALTVRDPSVLIKIFVTVLGLYILILFGFFLFGKAFDFGNEKILCAFILFLIPNVAFHILINFVLLADDFIFLLTWFLQLIEDTFFYKTSIYDTLWESRFLGSLFTDLPFIFAFLGGLAKRKKEAKRR